MNCLANVLTLGNDNGNVDDDFAYPNGTQALNSTATEEEIYPWGLTWITTNKTSIFVYRKYISNYRNIVLRIHTSYTVDHVENYIIVDVHIF